MAIDFEKQREVLKALKSQGHDLAKIKERYNTLTPEKQEAFFTNNAEKLGISILPPTDAPAGRGAPLPPERQQEAAQDIERGGAVSTAIMSASRGFFDLPMRGAAAIEAVGEEIQERISGAPAKTFGQRYAEIVDKKSFVRDKLEVANPGAALVGDISGFFGTSKFLKAGQLAKGAAKAVGAGGNYLGRLIAAGGETAIVEGAQALTSVNSEETAGDVAKMTGFAVGGQAVFDGALATMLGGAGAAGRATKFLTKPVIAKLRNHVSDDVLRVMDDLPKAIKLKSTKARQEVIARFQSAINGTKEKLAGVSTDGLSDEAVQLAAMANNSLDDTLRMVTEGIEEGLEKDITSPILEMGGRFKMARQSLNRSYGKQIEGLYKQAGDTAVDFSDELKPLYDVLEDAGVLTRAPDGSITSFSDKISRQYSGASDLLRTMGGAKELTFEQGNKLKSLIGEIADFSPAADPDGKFLATIWGRFRNKLANPAAFGDEVATNFDGLSTKYSEMRRVTDTLSSSAKKADEGLGTGAETLLNKIEQAFKAGQKHDISFSKTDLGGKIDRFLNQTDFNVLDEADKFLIKNTLGTVRERMVIKQYRSPEATKSLLKNFSTKGPDFVRDKMDELSKYFDVAEASRTYQAAMDAMPVPEAVKQALADPTNPKLLASAREALTKAKASDLLSDFNALHKKIVTQQRVANLPSQFSKAIKEVDKLRALPDQEIAGLQYMYDMIPELRPLLDDASFVSALEKQPGLLGTLTGVSLSGVNVTGAEAFAAALPALGLAYNGVDSSDVLLAAPFILMRMSKNPTAAVVLLEQAAGMNTKTANVVAQKMFNVVRNLTTFGRLARERSEKQQQQAIE